MQHNCHPFFKYNECVDMTHGYTVEWGQWVDRTYYQIIVWGYGEPMDVGKVIIEEQKKCPGHRESRDVSCIFVECIYNLSGNHCLVGLLFNYYVASSGVKLILGL